MGLPMGHIPRVVKVDYGDLRREGCHAGFSSPSRTISKSTFWTGRQRYTNDKSIDGRQKCQKRGRNRDEVVESELKPGRYGGQKEAV